MSRTLVGAVILAGATLAVAVPHAQNAAAMNKPIQKFTIGDLFPKFTAGLAETSAGWKSAADKARSLASTRSRDIESALGPVKDQLDKAKEAAKTAEKNKDFAAAGVAQGQVKTGSIVVDLLERLRDVAGKQDDMATAWAQAADMMRKFTESDDAFDKYRSAGIARPESGQGDTRLDSAGYEAFKGHASSLKDLGDALSQLGNKLNALGSERLKFAAELEKGGHIKSK